MTRWLILVLVALVLYVAGTVSMSLAPLVFAADEILESL